MGFRSGGYSRHVQVLWRHKLMVHHSVYRSFSLHIVVCLNSVIGFYWYFGWLKMDRSLVDDVPEGVHINFLRAERSLHRWCHEDVQRIHTAEQIASCEGAGVQMHVLEDAGHWVRLLSSRMVCLQIQYWFQKVSSEARFGQYTNFKILNPELFLLVLQVHTDNPDGLFRLLTPTFGGPNFERFWNSSELHSSHWREYCSHLYIVGSAIFESLIQRSSCRIEFLEHPLALYTITLTLLSF